MKSALFASLGVPLLFGLHCQEPTGKPETKLDGTLIVCNQKDGSVSLVRLRDGVATSKIFTGPGPHEVAVSPDGKTALVTIYGDQTSVGDSLLMVDVAKGEPIKTIRLGDYKRPHGIAFLSPERALVTSEVTQNVVVVNVADGKVERAIPTGAPGSHMLALAPDGKTVYSANIPVGTVTKLEVATGKNLGVANVGKGSEGIGISPDGKWVVTANRGEGSISLVDTATMKTAKTTPASGVPYRVAFTRDGKQALVPNPELGNVHVVNVPNLNIARSLDLGGGPATISLLGGPRPMGTGIFVHPRDNYAFVSVLNANCIAVLDLDKGNVIQTLPTGASPDGIAWSPVEVKG